MERTSAVRKTRVRLIDFVAYPGNIEIPIVVDHELLLYIMSHDEIRVHLALFIVIFFHPFHQIGLLSRCRQFLGSEEFLQDRQRKLGQ